MFDKGDFKPFKWRDLEGKMLEIHYGYCEGYYCVIGLDKETDAMYLLSSGKGERNVYRLL